MDCIKTISDVKAYVCIVENALQVQFDKQMEEYETRLESAKENLKNYLKDMAVADNLVIGVSLFIADGDAMLTVTIPENAMIEINELDKKIKELEDKLDVSMVTVSEWAVDATSALLDNKEVPEPPYI